MYKKPHKWCRKTQNGVEKNPSLPEHCNSLRNVLAGCASPVAVFSCVAFGVFSTPRWCKKTQNGVEKTPYWPSYTDSQAAAFLPAACSLFFGSWAGGGRHGGAWKAFNTCAANLAKLWAIVHCQVTALGCGCTSCLLQASICGLFRLVPAACASFQLSLRCTCRS